MELLREWFLPGESDLLFYGLSIIVIAALFPMEQAGKKSLRTILICLAGYAVCEAVVSLWWQNWVIAYCCLFLGGMLLAVAVGRLLRYGFCKLRRK